MTANPEFETYNVLHSPEDVEEEWEDAEALLRRVYRVRPDQDFCDGSVQSGPDIVIANEAYKLRMILVCVNNMDQLTECILDPSSQIITISEKKVPRSKVAWDPKVELAAAVRKRDA